jgi:hypothetical protein
MARNAEQLGLVEKLFRRGLYAIERYALLRH